MFAIVRIIYMYDHFDHIATYHSLSMVSGSVPSRRRRIWTIFSYPVYTTGRTRRISASTDSFLARASGVVKIAGQRDVAAIHAD